MKTLTSFPRRTVMALATATAVWATTAPSQAQTAADEASPLTLRLALVEGGKTAGSTLGLQYQYERRWSANGDAYTRVPPFPGA